MRSLFSVTGTSRVTRSVAAVALAMTVAACGGGDEAADPGSTEGADIVAVGTDALKWTETELTAEAGTIVVGLEAEGAVNHNFVIEGVNGDEAIVEVAGKSAGTGTVDLEEGTYRFYCSIVGHEAAGMVGELVVE